MTDPADRQPASARRRKAGRPPANESTQTRQALLDTAARHFAHNGYGKATLNDIAREANLTASAIYYYFDSKAALYTAVAERWVEPLNQQVLALLQPGLGLADSVILYLERVIDYMVKEPDFAWFWLHVDMEASHHQPVAELRAKMWLQTVKVRARFASGAYPSTQASEAEEQLRSYVPPPGSELLPGVLLIEALALGVMRLAVQIPGGWDRLPLVLEPLKKMIRGNLDQVEAEHHEAERRLWEDASKLQTHLPVMRRPVRKNSVRIRNRILS